LEHELRFLEGEVREPLRWSLEQHTEAEHAYVEVE